MNNGEMKTAKIVKYILTAFTYHDNLDIDKIIKTEWTVTLREA